LKSILLIFIGVEYQLGHHPVPVANCYFTFCIIEHATNSVSSNYISKQVKVGQNVYVNNILLFFVTLNFLEFMLV